MTLAQTIQEARGEIRAFIRGWSDQKISEVYAFNQDGKMIFLRPCCCLIGVTSSENLHDRECFEPHYGNYMMEYTGAERAEEAYWRLGLTYADFRDKCWSKQVEGTVRDARRRIRLSTILRAEMHHRARQRQTTASAPLAELQIA